MSSFWKPFRESAANRYCRLFPPSQPAVNIDRYCDTLTALGCAMIDDGSRVSDERPEILVDSGYTYFGQFIAHDLTKDLTTIEEAWEKEPEEIENLQSPRLNLDSLYGGGPANSPELYETDGVRLTVGGAGSGGCPFDISTSAEGERLLADDRAAANLILRQMTAVFARLHNFAVKQFRSECSDGEELFEQARQQTQWQFQYLVVADYLPALLDPRVYKKLFAEERSTIAWERFSIPIEVSAAALRFGHAMVRPNYLFSFGQEMFLPKILGRTSDRGPVQSELEINWGLFFQGASSVGVGAVTSRPIDTRLAPALQHLPPDLIGVPQPRCPHSASSDAPSQLAVRTLLRGAGLRLASGQTVAAGFGEAVLNEEELTLTVNGERCRQGEILRRAGLTKQTPLWYYVLKESELKQNGNRVGAVGSHLIAETIYSALRMDPKSYFNCSSTNESPPIWKFPDGEQRIYGLSELFRAARLF